MPPGPGFGDSIGAMTIAGGIMGALFHRERTGEAPVVDVSLFGSGLWAMGQSMALSLLLGIPFTAPPADRVRANPLTGNYQTKDGRFLSLCCLQAGRYWAELCQLVGRPEMAIDPRFADHASLINNGAAARELLQEIFARRSLEDWREDLVTFRGQWVPVQDTLEAAADPQAQANGYLQECKTASGSPFQLISAPVQFDEQPAPVQRAPQFNEHGDEILAELGLDWNAVVDLKVRHVVA
jgi:crotonobetainyl-CoA:carnitine CoA-transferase CaiB-like acyl-CoA transferase